jgi:hypothetical protein
MKKLLTLIVIQFLGVFLLQGSSQGSEIALQTAGLVKYYVLQDSKTVVIQPPYIMTLSLTRATSAVNDFYGAYLSAKLDVETERPELTEIKKRYAGYKFETMGPSAFESINVDLGLSGPLNVTIPASTDFFMGSKKLTVAEGEDLIKRFSSTPSNMVSVSVKASRPISTLVGRITLNMEDACSTLATVHGKKTFGRVLSNITKLSQWPNATTDDLRSKLQDFILNKCVAISSANGFDSMEELLQMPVTVLNGTGIEYLESRQIKYVDVDQTWPVDVKLVIQ